MVDGQDGVVHELARRLPATVPTRADLRAVVSEMFAHDVMWLVCVDDEGRFTGVITQPGVTRVLGETYRQDAAAAE
jgi:osmoprotectant transport system ATP-binding protein